MENRKHLILKNEAGISKKFNSSRGYTPEELPLKPSSAYSTQKENLRILHHAFNEDNRIKTENRSIQLDANFDYILIDFFILFGNGAPFYAERKFYSDFGLVPVVRKNFNQTVLFAVSNRDLFREFIALLSKFYNSPDNIHPKETEYSIITIIQSFKLLRVDNQIDSIGNQVHLKLINSLLIENDLEYIKTKLREHIQRVGQAKEKSIIFKEDLIELKGFTREDLLQIVQNFDVIQKVQSLRTAKIVQGTYGDSRLSYGIQTTLVENPIKVGIIDNGVKKIEPLSPLLKNGIDLTGNNDPFNTNNTHGTSVAGLVAFGQHFFDINHTKFQSVIEIFPIKAFEGTESELALLEIERGIREAHLKGVNIFNLSLTTATKDYNSGISDYAELLDDLAYELDILIFIASGNLDNEVVEEIKDELKLGNNESLLKYPNHFYNPNKNEEYMFHNCECSNIGEPAESYNNVTVGAIACNLSGIDMSDMTISKNLPAYYTKKHYLDYSKKINETNFQKNQKNNNINKPDIVMSGGDLLNEISGMQVLGFGLSGKDYYLRTAGSSLSTPLVTHIAGKLAYKYPELNTNSLKAIILNSASVAYNSDYLKDLLNNIKNEYSMNEYQSQYESLSKNEKKKINGLFNPDNLNKKLIGAGIPNEDLAMASHKKKVMILIEDGIELNTHKAINLNLPEYLNTFSRSSFILSLKATICYKFIPVKDNHLAYNPLHISFNFAKSLVRDNPSRNAEIIANSEDEYYQQFYNDGMETNERTKQRNLVKGVKKKFSVWSEDFFPRNTKPFSNTQDLDINITKDELDKIDNQLSILIRCTGKEEGVFPNTTNYLQNNSHPFSICLIIEEKQNDELKNFDLYNELMAINNLEIVGDISLDQELDI